MKKYDFDKRNKIKIDRMSKDKKLRKKSEEWFLKSYKYEYSYHFKWLDRPIIQYPQDILALQEIIWDVKPDLIIETGVAHGGSLIFSASMLELLGKGKVLGIDIKIHQHNRKEIEKHKLFKRIKILEGSSVDDDIIKQVNKIAKNKRKILVILDSNHTHEHVMNELEIYSKLVSKNSYLIVFDTVIGNMGDKFFIDRPWNNKKNPKSAVKKFLQTNKRFKIDKEVENKLLITAAPDGYLKCIKK